MTGQAQTSAYTATTFKNAVCTAVGGLFKCPNIYLNVTSY